VMPRGAQRRDDFVLAGGVAFVKDLEQFLAPGRPHGHRPGVDGRSCRSLGVGHRELGARGVHKARFMMKIYASECINANPVGPGAGGAPGDDRVDRGVPSGRGRIDQQSEATCALRMIRSLSSSGTTPRHDSKRAGRGRDQE
jgi:hypothetical protein